MIREKGVIHAKTAKQLMLNRINYTTTIEIEGMKIVNKRLIDSKCKTEICFTKKELHFVMNNLELFI